MGVCEPCVGSAHAAGGQRGPRCLRRPSTGASEPACWAPHGGGGAPWQRRQHSVGIPVVLLLMVIQPLLLLLMPLVHAHNATLHQERLQRYSQVLNKSTQQSKNCTDGTKWPLDDDLGNNTLLVGFLPFTTTGPDEGPVQTTTVERLGLKIPGAFSWAVDKVNNDSILPDGYKMQFEVYDTQGSEIRSTQKVTELFCNNAAAIFGPENTCHVEGTIAAAYNRVMMSYACSNEILNDKNKYKTFARTNPSESTIVYATIEVLKEYNWKKFSILYDEEYTTVVDQLVASASKENMTINHKELFISDNCTAFFQESKEKTRIYVYVGHRHQVNQLLIAMAMTGIFLPANNDTDKAQKYMLIYLDTMEYKPNEWKTYVWRMNH